MRARTLLGAVALATAVSGCSAHETASAGGSLEPGRRTNPTSTTSATAAPSTAAPGGAGGSGHRPSSPPAATQSPTTPHNATPDTPAASAARYVFPVRNCQTSYAHVHHDYPATDIFATRGCAFVAVTAGRVDEATDTDTWSARTNLGAARGGLSVSVIGDDGVRYYGSHLSSLAAGIAAGSPVQAGQLLGAVGDSGDAKGVGTHVHFGISWPSRAQDWWVRRGELYPWPYLDSWRIGGARTPAPAVTSLRAQRGQEPVCTVDC